MRNRLQQLWHRTKRHLPSQLSGCISLAGRSVLAWIAKRYTNTPHFRAKVVRLTEQSVRTVQRDDEFFKGYAQTQIARSFGFNRGQVFGPMLMDRTAYLVRLMDRVLPERREHLRVLCVGCRNIQELEHIEAVCRVQQVEGLDLFSEDPRIQIGDMHHMPYPDAHFDVVYACHSLEHSYDLHHALAECVRVAKEAGVLVIEVPVRYPVTDVDRWDVGSAGALIDYLGGDLGEVLVREDTETVARLIVRLQKTARTRGRASS